MNPQQSNGSYPPAPSGGNPYDFITAAPPKPPRTTRGAFGGGSFVGKLLGILGAAVVLMVAIVVVINLLFGDKTNFGNIISLAQTQQEIVRVTRQSQPLSDQTLAGAAISTRLTILTQQQNLLVYLTGHRQKVAPKDLALKKNQQTDQQFLQAKATSTFDLVFTQVIKQQLTDYASNVKTAYQHATNKELKSILAADYQQTQMLLKQWPADE